MPPAQPPNNTDSLDDIFGSTPPDHNIPLTTTTTTPQTNEPSDLPSLRRQHVTAGYRDGLTASKGQHVQEGFDAGFPVGAQLGMRAGTVLGILEGLIRGYEGKPSSGVVKKQPPRGATATATGQNDEERERAQEMRRQKRERILKIYRDAVKELEVQGVFSGLDGNAIMGEGQEKKKPQDELQKIGERVIAKWEERVSVAKWEENMEALEMRDAEANAGTGSEAAKGGVEQS